MKANIQAGSTIVCDEWGGYSNLSENEYEHKTVCHKYNFVDTESRSHTQSI